MHDNRKLRDRRDYENNSARKDATKHNTTNPNDNNNYTLMLSPLSHSVRKRGGHILPEHQIAGQTAETSSITLSALLRNM